MSKKISFVSAVCLLSLLAFVPSPANAEEVQSDVCLTPEDSCAEQDHAAIEDKSDAENVDGFESTPQSVESEEPDGGLNDSSDQTFFSVDDRSGQTFAGWKRVWGNNAFDTMSEIANSGWSESDAVVIASGSGYWDALAANSLAGALGCPVLLTDGSSLSPQSASQIKRLGASKAYICGGPFSVSERVEGQLKSAGCTTVKRLYGQKQDQTAVSIARLALELRPSQACIIATSSTFHDALGIASYSYASGAPIITCANGSNSLSSEALNFIRESGFKSAVIVGGPMSISNSVESSLQSCGVDSIERLQGQSAYETSVAVARWGLSHGMKADGMGVATGDSYYDALSGAALCGKNHSVLVIAGQGNRIALTDFVSEQRASISGGFVFGGAMSISDSVYHTLEYCWKNGYSNDYATDEEAPYKAVYNYEYYRANNPDVKQAFGNNRQATLDHFLNSGMRERRRGCEGFDVRSYYNQYEDLRRAFAVNWPAYYRHFMDYGQREGRAGTGCGAVSGWQYHNVPWHGQPNNFYCGPTSGQMILEAAGKWGSANGTPLNVWNVAKYMHTDAYHFTSFNDRWFERGMNDWLGYRAYTTLHAPSYGAARVAVMRSYDRGLAAAVDAQERRGGPHFNGHNNGTFSHIMVVDGYNNANDHVIIADPGAKVLWGGASQKFEYPSLNNFITTYCQHEIMGDGKQHIGMYVPV